MKRVALLFVWLMLVVTPALADVPEEALAAMRAVYPEALLLDSAADGDDAFFAIETAEDEPRRLLHFGQSGGEWCMTFDSAAALRPVYIENAYRAWRVNEPVTLLLDDSRLSICYHDANRRAVLCTYTFEQTETDWRFRSFVTGGQEPDILSWQDGCIWQTSVREERDGVAEHCYPPCPMPWLADSLSLAAFDASEFPTDLHELSDEDEARIAAILAPDCTCVSGLFSYPEATFLLDMPDGTRRFAAFAWESGAWRRTLSTPLPADTWCDDFHSGAGSLIIGFTNPNGTDLDDDGIASCEMCLYLHEDGRWYIDTIADDWGDAFFFGENCLSDNYGLRYHGVPTFERDVTKANWLNLPTTVDEAVAAMDGSRWGLLSGNSALNLTHLRTAPSFDAPSLGRYVEGTPVYLLDTPPEHLHFRRAWYHVAILGGDVTGWMNATVYNGANQITRDEDFGWVNTTAARPIITLRSAEQPVCVYDAPDGQLIHTYPAGWDEWVELLGITDDGWYHVYSGYEFEDGFVRVSDCCDAAG